MNTLTPLKFDNAEIKRGLTAFFPPGDVIEIRAIGADGKISAGYFDNIDTAAAEATKLSGQVTGVYVVLNPIDKSLLSRAYNRIKIKPKELTQDKNVISRRYIPLDIDPDRPTGISSTDAEHQAALDIAAAIKSHLVARGFPYDSIIIGDSGNGAHALIHCELPNTPESEKIVKGCIGAIKASYGKDGILIDESVFNPSRIWKLPGTMACKGDNTPERPHRIARLVEAPTQLVIAPNELLTALAAEAPAPEPKPLTTKTYGGQPFNLESWLSTHDIEIQRSEGYDGGTRYILTKCVFDGSHNGTSAAIIQLANSAVAYKCQHNSCANKTWAMVRELKEPGYVHTFNSNNTRMYNTNATKTAEAKHNKNATENATSECEGADKTQQESLSKRIEDWVNSTAGWFDTLELDRDLGTNTPRDKNNRREIMLRLEAKGIIERHPKISKQFRYVNTKVTSLNFKTATNTGILPLKWPLGIEDFVNLYPTNEVVVAGAPNAGKTALFLNFIYLNQDNFPIYYICSEMGAVELRCRLDKFPGMDINGWKFEAIERAGDFADVIRPDCINIIDYLEMTTELYTVNIHLTAISHKLGSGIAIIALQKKQGAIFGRGQEFGMEKPKLYLSLDKHRMQIVKGKSWAQKDVDPNGLTVNFKILDGCRFEKTNEWDWADK